MFRNLLIIVAVFGLGWGGSFAAGMTYGQRQAALASPVGAGAQSGARAIGASTPQPGGAGQTGGFGGQGGPGGRMTVGTVARVDGLTVFLTTGENQEVAITVSAQTPITRPEPVALADLAPGTRVTVMAQGAPGATAVPGSPLVAQSISVMVSGTGVSGAGGRGQVGSSSGPTAPSTPTAAPTSAPAIAPTSAPAIVPTSAAATVPTSAAAIVPTNVSSQPPTVEARVATPQAVVSDAQSTPTDPGQGQRGPRADVPRPGGPPGGGPGQGARAPAGQGQGGPEGRQPGGPSGQTGGPGQSGPEGRAPGGQGGPGGRGPAAPPTAPPTAP
ncbi:MAG: hypothetical protein ACOYOM_10190 [Chloroflexota bacterium]